jgi:hypothetical protein
MTAIFGKRGIVYVYFGYSHGRYYLLLFMFFDWKEEWVNWSVYRVAHITANQYTNCSVYMRAFHGDETGAGGGEISRPHGEETAWEAARWGRVWSWTGTWAARHDALRSHPPLFVLSLSSALISVGARSPGATNSRWRISKRQGGG